MPAVTMPRLEPGPFALVIALLLVFWLAARTWLVRRFDDRNDSEALPPRTPAWLARFARWRGARLLLWALGVAISAALLLTLR